MADAPKPNEVRRSPGGRTFVVLGDAGDGSSGDDMYRYREAHTTVMETTGRWTGAKFNVPTRAVSGWERQRMTEHETGARRGLPGEGGQMSGPVELAEQLEVAVKALERIRDHADGAGDAPLIAQQAINEIRGTV